MGCSPLICGKLTYNYHKEQKLLEKVISQFHLLPKCYSHDFVVDCHRKMLENPSFFLLKYQKKIEKKQIVPHTILEKWKLILYGTNYQNQYYSDCLGFDKNFQEERAMSKTYQFSKGNPFQIQLQDLYFHSSYKQIQKDAARVYLVPQIKQQIFQILLKKIANHFPESGYSLGVNYIVGYFLLVGMSQMDSFWMFVHLALNEKFLALGFFENDLPLTKIIIEIFKNILRRKNKELYNFIFKHLQMDQASWILKWLTSFFLATFPIQFCHYILDYIFSFGILGLAVVSFSILNFFQEHILKCKDSMDFMATLQQLFNFQYFCQKVKIYQFMSSIYEISLCQQDFDFQEKVQDSFYSKYFTLYCEQKFKPHSKARFQINQLLSNWYKLHSEKRDDFTKTAQSLNNKISLSNRESSRLSYKQNSQKYSVIKGQTIKKQQSAVRQRKHKRKFVEPQNRKANSDFQASFPLQIPKKCNSQIVSLHQSKKIILTENYIPKTLILKNQAIEVSSKNFSASLHSFQDSLSQQCQKYHRTEGFDEPLQFFSQVKSDRIMKKRKKNQIKSEKANSMTKISKEQNKHKGLELSRGSGQMPSLSQIREPSNSTKEIKSVKSFKWVQPIELIRQEESMQYSQSIRQIQPQQRNQQQKIEENLNQNFSKKLQVKQNLAESPELKDSQVILDQNLLPKDPKFCEDFHLLDQKKNNFFTKKKSLIRDTQNSKSFEANIEDQFNKDLSVLNLNQQPQKSQNLKVWSVSLDEQQKISNIQLSNIQPVLNSSLQIQFNEKLPSANLESSEKLFQNALEHSKQQHNHSDPQEQKSARQTP